MNTRQLLRLSLLSLLLSMVTIAHGQGDARWIVSLEGGPGYVANTFENRNAMMDNYVYPTFTLRMGYQTDTTDAMALWYGCPRIGMAITYSAVNMLDFTTPSHLGDITSLNSFIMRDFYRSERFSVGYIAFLGLGMNSSIYDSIDNPLNRLFSSSLVIHLGAGLQATYRPAEHWELGLMGHFGHYSTGRQAYPNSGLNEVTVNASVSYAMVPQPHVLTQQEWEKKMLYEVYVGEGLHKCSMEWRAFGKTKPWTNYVMGGSAMWQYRRNMSSGVGLEVFKSTDDFLEMLHNAEQILYEKPGDGHYSTWSGGISYVQQMHWNNFSVWGSVGCYLFRDIAPHEQTGFTYQRIGAKYCFPKLGGLFVALDCKTHRFSKAAMLEFTAGFRL
ncbi:MAG: acyloxyacyl hydrolase [Bacteroidales bacterium]|nr:acyloxyacyl hydrolase [Bacteroidales bacterium]